MTWQIQVTTQSIRRITMVEAAVALDAVTWPRKRTKYRWSATLIDVSPIAREDVPACLTSEFPFFPFRITELSFLVSFRITVTKTSRPQGHVRILGFYRPSHTGPLLTPGIQICSRKWSEVYILIGFSYISQVKILYEVKFSKLEICQSNCRFKILGKKISKESFFFWNFKWNIVKINVKHPK